MTVAGRLRRTALAAATLALLGGCAPGPREPPPAIESSRTYESQSREGVFERLFAALEASGLEVVSADPDRGAIVAVHRGFEDRSWADCPLRRVTSRDDTRRVRQARPLEREVELSATVREGAAGPTVTLEPVFVERQLDTFTNLPLNQSCRSTGVLERQLLQALAP